VCHLSEAFSVPLPCQLALLECESRYQVPTLAKSLHASAGTNTASERESNAFHGFFCDICLHWTGSTSSTDMLARYLFPALSFSSEPSPFHSQPVVLFSGPLSAPLFCKLAWRWQRHALHSRSDGFPTYLTRGSRLASEKRAWRRPPTSPLPRSPPSRLTRPTSGRLHLCPPACGRQ
jgi:hypothetical protein